MAAVSPPAKAEPARPEVRKAQHLAPKSYASAAHEAVDGISQDSSAGEAHRSRSAPVKGKKGSGPTANGVKDRTDEAQLYHPYEDANGGHLTSVRPVDGTPAKASVRERSGAQKAAKDRGTLVSGRRAGAGWERSGYGAPGFKRRAC